VIVPQFDDPHDRVAREILARLFPEREIIGLPAFDLVWGLGAYHCLSQQEPAQQEPAQQEPAQQEPA
jgi:agmatine deiminase